MITPPEMMYDKATPNELLHRLEIIRDRYLMALVTPAEFNEMLKQFQFTDDRGVVWTPGAKTNQWYYWDQERWIAADPPAMLNLPPLPAMFVPIPST